MILCAIAISIFGFAALRHMRRCHGYYGHGWGHHHHGWHGWHGGGGYGGDDGGWGGGPPWMRHRMRGRGRKRWMLHAALAKIDASPAQERAIVAEIDKLEERVHGAKASLRDARGDLGAAMRGPSLDDAALGAVLGRTDTATGELRAAVLDALRNVHAILDDRQRNELADLLERGPFGWRGRGGGGGGPYRM